MLAQSAIVYPTLVLVSARAAVFPTSRPHSKASRTYNWRTDLSAVEREMASNQYEGIVDTIV